MAVVLLPARSKQMDEVTITLPAYAVRYLREMCVRERHWLANHLALTGHYQIGHDASFDSLSAIECALPDEPK
jgi:hypothetical protein